jgi:hypothetical protein
VQLILAHILEGQLVRRFHEVPAEVLYGADVGLLGIRRHVADRHVVDHAPAQRRDVLCHGRTPVDGLPDPAIVAGRMRAGEARFPAVCSSARVGKVLFSDYRDLGEAYLDQISQTRTVANLKRRLERLGYNVTLEPKAKPA